jgi:beta-glucosidase
LQGDDISQGIVATLKHFVGYGKSEGGLNWAPADIPPRMLREVYLHPFERAIKESGALSLMNAYHEIDGIPCCASTELLTRILHDEWKFQGIVISDYYAIESLQSYHRVAADAAEAAKLALSAGIDAELPKTNCYGAPLKELVEEGLVPMELVDRALARVLKLKFMLGLFDKPYVNPKDAARVFDLPEFRQLSLEAARKSIVLLKNEGGILPLSKSLKTVAVIGPNADNQRNILGDYTYPAHIDITVMAANAMNVSLPVPEPEMKELPVSVVSILSGIKAKAGKRTKVLYARGCDYNSPDKGGFAEAVNLAKEAEVAIVVAGGKSGLTPDCTCGEMRDSADLRLPGVQEELVKAIYDTGTPVVLVLADGRPLVLGWMAEKIPAILEVWLPGEEGGNAVADILFGDYNPGGKLPIAFPRKVGQIPVYHGHKPSGARSQLWGDYVDVSTQPLYEFGYGLSYTTFKFSNLRVQPEKVKMGGKVRVRVEVENTGDVAGEEVVQLYVDDIVASVTRPVRELKGFKRIALKPGETRTVEFELSTEDLSFYGKDMKRIVEPGEFGVGVGPSSSNLPMLSKFEVVA